MNMMKLGDVVIVHEGYDEGYDMREVVLLDLIGPTLAVVAEPPTNRRGDKRQVHLVNRDHLREKETTPPPPPTTRVDVSGRASHFINAVNCGLNKATALVRGDSVLIVSTVGDWQPRDYRHRTTATPFGNPMDGRYFESVVAHGMFGIVNGATGERGYSIAFGLNDAETRLAHRYPASLQSTSFWRPTIDQLAEMGSEALKQHEALCVEFEQMVAWPPLGESLADAVGVSQKTIDRMDESDSIEIERDRAVAALAELVKRLECPDMRVSFTAGGSAICYGRALQDAKDLLEEMTDD